MPECLREFLRQPGDRVVQAEVVEHQRAQVGRDAPHRGHGAVEHRVHLRGAWRRAPRSSGGSRSRSQARSIFIAVSSWPSSSCSSRAMQRLLLLARLQHARREFAQLGLLAHQRVLVLLAPGDVAQDHRVEAVAAFARLRDRGLDREFLAVGAQRPQRGGVAHAPVGDAGVAEVLDVAVVRGAEARRQEARRASSRAPRARLQRKIGSAAWLNSTMRCVLVDGDDGVHRRVHRPRRAAPAIRRSRCARCVRAPRPAARSARSPRSRRPAPSGRRPGRARRARACRRRTRRRRN